ncbi:MAG: PEP-CTERM sorting domain-containing protein [Bryobacteraceae bacterium]
MRTFIGVTVLFILLCPAALPLSFTSMGINSPAGLTVNGAGTPDVTFSGLASGYQISGELCGDGFCGGAAGPTTQPATIHLTNLTITCVAGAAPCGSLSLGFFGSGLGVSIGTPLDILVTFDGNVDGTAQATGSYNIDVFSNGPDANVFQNFNVNPGVFSFGPFVDSTSTAGPGFGFNGFVQLNSLATGQTFTLGSSFDIVISQAVPEPGAWLLLAGGLLALSVRRRR